MTRRQSRASRQAAFMEEAKKAYDNLENWYDANPETSFGEIEKGAFHFVQKGCKIGFDLLVKTGDSFFDVINLTSLPHKFGRMTEARTRRKAFGSQLSKKGSG